MSTEIIKSQNPVQQYQSKIIAPTFEMVNKAIGTVSLIILPLSVGNWLGEKTNMIRATQPIEKGLTIAWKIAILWRLTKVPGLLLSVFLAYSKLGDEYSKIVGKIPPTGPLYRLSQWTRGHTCEVSKAIDLWTKNICKKQTKNKWLKFPQNELCWAAQKTSKTFC